MTKVTEQQIMMTRDVAYNQFKLATTHVSQHEHSAHGIGILLANGVPIGGRSQGARISAADEALRFIHQIKSAAQVDPESLKFIFVSVAVGINPETGRMASVTKRLKNALREYPGAADLTELDVFTPHGELHKTLTLR